MQPEVNQPSATNNELHPELAEKPNSIEEVSNYICLTQNNNSQPDKIEGCIGFDLDLNKIENIRVDLKPALYEEAIRIAKKALASEKTMRDVARVLKKEFDEKFEPVWHCIVGRNFGSYMSHGMSSSL